MLRLIVRHKSPDGEIVRTVGYWRPGRDLVAEIERYRESLLPGGRKAWGSEYLGYAPIPFEAVVMDGDNVVERWDAEADRRLREAIAEYQARKCRVA